MIMEHRKGIAHAFARRKRKKGLVKDKKYHTLLIMSPTSGKRVIELTFPTMLWWFSFIVAGATLFWVGAGTWSVYQNHKISMRSDCLEKENQVAKEKLRAQKKEINYLQGQLINIQEQASYIQQYLGLDPNGEAKGQIGQGGGDISFQFLNTPQSLPFWNKPTLPSIIDSFSPDNLSHQNITQLDKDLDQIISSLEKKQHELERTPSISPIDHQKAWISCRYGMRVNPRSGKKQFHAAVDIAGWKGTPVMATANGKVSFSQMWGSMGLTVKIDHNSIFKTTYGHLLRVAVKKGQDVKRGEIVGYVGNSGRSRGYHLHYEIIKDGKRTNPLLFMADWKKNRTVLAAGKK